MSAPLADHDPLFAHWREMFDLLEPDVLALHLRREVFERIDNEVVSKASDVGGIFCEDFLRPIYSEAQAVMIRRLTDRSDGTVSLWRLLDSMKRNATVMTRKRYLDLWDISPEASDDHWRLEANRIFDMWAGSSATHLPAEVLAEHQRALTAASSAVTEFVDKYVAHLDSQREQVRAATWKELDAAITEIGRKFTQIGLFLTATRHEAHVYIQEPWTAVFSRLFPRG